MISFVNSVNIMYFACILDGSFMYIQYKYFLLPPNLMRIVTLVIIMYNFGDITEPRERIF